MTPNLIIVTKETPDYQPLDGGWSFAVKDDTTDIYNPAMTKVASINMRLSREQATIFKAGINCGFDGGYNQGIYDKTEEIKKALRLNG